MLGANYTAIGIGRAYTAGSPYGWYWTTDFGGYFRIAIQPGANTANTTRQALNYNSTGVGIARLYAGGNVMLSVISCLVAVWLGHVLGTTINATSR